MFRRTAQWIAYFIIVIALVCGLEVIGNLPVQSQSSLPLGTHLWLVLWCALGLMIPIFVWFSRTYRRRSSFARRPSAPWIGSHSA